MTEWVGQVTADPKATDSSGNQTYQVKIRPDPWSDVEGTVTVTMPYLRAQDTVPAGAKIGNIKYSVVTGKYYCCLPTWLAKDPTVVRTLT